MFLAESRISAGEKMAEVASLRIAIYHQRASRWFA
jgi:hypothetical protein